jgi:hypothetical protein
MAKSCLVYLFGFDTLYMVAYFLNPRTAIYGIVSLFDAKYTVENYWMWFGICNMVLAGYTIVTHVVLFFLLRSALFDRVFPIYVPFYGLVAPVITSTLFFLSCLWTLLDHTSGNSKFYLRVSTGLWRDLFDLVKHKHL